MNAKRLLIFTACFAVGACNANAKDSTSGPRYVPRPDVLEGDYTQDKRVEDESDTTAYKQYEQREPCQNYRKVPREYIDNCKMEVVEEEIQEAAVVSTSHDRQEKIVRSYTVLFDFDKSDVRQNELITLDQAMQEIDKYDPQKVTVTGYTDSSGTKDYNQKLSTEREQEVSTALLERGIENQTIDREARGEYEQAVNTEDGIKNQENRRVVIDFVR